MAKKEQKKKGNSDKRDWVKVQEFLYNLAKEEPNIIFQVVKQMPNKMRIGSRNIPWDELKDIGADNIINISANNRWNVKTQDLFLMINQIKGLRNYVPIDIDPEPSETKEDTQKRFMETLKMMKEDGLKGITAVATGSKGYHIVVKFKGFDCVDKATREKAKEYFIRMYGGEIGKEKDSANISLDIFFNKGELCMNHWKTNKPVSLQFSSKGCNDALNTIEAMKSYVKAESENKHLESFILDESLLPQTIEHALGMIEYNGELLRYYGARIHEVVTVTKGNKTSKVQMKVPVIVLEGGKIISESKKPYGLNFKFDTNMTLKFDRWSLESIRNFCMDYYKENEVSFEKVYHTFKKLYDESMIFEFDEWYIFNPLWDLCTYFFDYIDKFPIIKHEGKSGSAKSKGMKISANLSFNGKKFLCPTPATFFRYRNNNKAMLCIEEAEKLFDDTKKGNNGDSELVEYLNGSYEKGNTVPRQDDKDINQTNEFDPAGFTRIGSILPLKGALQDRSLTLQMIKAPSGDKRAEVEIPAENDIEYRRARDLAYVCSLKNYKQYLSALKNVKNEYGMVNRQWLIAKPIIAMAHCVDPKLESQIGHFIKRLYEIRNESVNEESWEFIMSITLIQLSAGEKEEYFLENKRLRHVFINNLTKAVNKEWNISQKKISSIMTTLGLSDYKTHNSAKTERGYNLEFFKISEILIRNDFVNVEIVAKYVSEVSNCPYAVGKLNKIGEWYRTHFGQIKKISNNVSVTHGQMDKSKKPSDTLKKTSVRDESVEFEGLSPSPVFSDRSDTFSPKIGGGVKNVSIEDFRTTPKNVFSKISELYNSKKQPVDIIQLETHFGEDIQESIDYLKKEGQVFEPKKGFVGLLN